MENASKALIIAGAILLSIVLISLGLIVVNNTRDTINGANTNQQEVDTFNSKFNSFVGSSRTPSDVRNLISTIIASNGAETKNATNNWVTIQASAITAAVAKPTAQPTIIMPSGLVNGHTFTIQVGTDNATGRVSVVSIKDNTDNKFLNTTGAF